MVKCTRLFFFLSAIIFSSLSVAQPVSPVEWGNIPSADLEMKSCPTDSGADAMILCDFGYSSFNHELDISYERHQRVKIFNKQGYEWGTYEILLYTEDKTEKIEDIEAVTYVLGADNKIEKYELNEDDIFYEKVSDAVTKCKFTLPNMQSGCVIEVKYHIICDNIYYLRDWTFQKSIPVRWSEYIVQVPKQIGYIIAPLGYEPYYINEKKDTTQKFGYLASELLGHSTAPCWYYRWVTKDTPALKDEPFISSMTNYVNRLQIQVYGINLVNTGKMFFYKDWQDLNQKLVKSETFGKCIDVTGDVEDLEKSITAGITDSLEKMIAIYNYVKDSIVWDETERISCSKEPDDVIETREGSNAEITMLLLSLMKSAGLTGAPVLISTRDNGYIQIEYPILNQFNYLIARVQVGGKKYLLDATNPLRTYDLLPIKVLNTTGLLIQEKEPLWVGIQSDVTSSKISLTQIKINNDGSVQGTLEISLKGYDAVKFRNGISETDTDDKIAKDYFNVEAAGINIDSAVINGKKDISETLKITAWFTSDEYAQVTDNMIYINPRIIRLKENPFKTEIRKFPVDYAYKRSSTEIINIEVPEGYELKDAYPAAKLNVGNFASFTSMGQLMSNNFFQIITKTDIREPIIEPEYYNDLKKFYSGMVDSQAGIIVLAKKTEAVVPASNTGK